MLRKIEDAARGLRREQVVSASRVRYATSRSTLEAHLQPVRAATADAPVDSEVRKSRRKVLAEESAPNDGAAALPGRGGMRHNYLQSLVKSIGEDHGFNVTIEKAVLGGHGHIDAVLERDGSAIACEISVTTRVEHEIQNLTKCLAAGFDKAVLVCSERETMLATRTAFAGSADRVTFLLPIDHGAYLAGSIARHESPPTPLIHKPVARAGEAVPESDRTGRRQILIARDAACVPRVGVVDACKTSLRTLFTAVLQARTAGDVRSCGSRCLTSHAETQVHIRWAD